MIETAFTIVAIVMAILLFPALFRAVAGPTTADRLVAVNVISTKVIVMIAFLAVMSDQKMFMDIAVVYAMIGFIATIAITRYIERGRL
jgi:multicomponent Na+:H+ antiporter subunit F